jgi:hypothetical protein
MNHHWKKISELVTEQALKILPHLTSSKLKSEVISNLFESQSADYFNSMNIPVRACESDRDPDLYFVEEEKPLEIKVTRCKHSHSKTLKWRGGKYSKRNSDHLFIAWHYIEPTIIDPSSQILYFMAQTYVESDEWKITDKGRNNYYATSFSSDNLINKNTEIILGNIAPNNHFILV